MPAGTSEIDALETLLAGVGLAGVVLTADALHTQTGTAAYLVEELHADYVLTVKRNQKALFAQVKALPWAQAPTLATTREHGHGRAETRTVKAIDLAGRTDFRTRSRRCAFAATSEICVPGRCRGPWLMQ